ncbi:MAG: hypothetical protein H6772_04795 [Pseudomonadales bacterium]|nr:hypothetical protein [Pseudomonadales bacterium]
MIIPVWKKVGESTHMLAKKTGEFIASKTNNNNDLKATHTGTLDPMAEGVVVVLTGDDRFKKAEFSDWKKIYQFEILFGVSTDSLDLLGLQTNLITFNLNLEEIKIKLESIIPSFIGFQKQLQPKFSAQRVKGKSGFDLAKKQQNFKIKSNNIEIDSLKLINTYWIENKKLLNKINHKLSLVNGDFRQEIIINNWNKNFKKLGTRSSLIIKLSAVVSKRTYIRSLVRDIAKIIGVPATTFSIVRTRNGIYSQRNCII